MPTPQDKKKKYEPPAPPPRVGKKARRRDGASSLGTKLPTITPTAKCKLRLLKLERVKDWLLMEEEFVSNQERLKPADERNEEERTKVGAMRGGAAGGGAAGEVSVVAARLRPRPLLRWTGLAGSGALARRGAHGCGEAMAAAH